MSRRRSAAKRRKGGGVLIKLIVFVVVVLGVGWAASTTYLLWQKVDVLPSVKGHDFISTPQDGTHFLLVAKQSPQAAELDSLMILAADFEDRTIASLELPTTLSDGATEIGQYLESHYYKEMQIAVEGQLAMPLSGYIVQSRVAMADGGDSIVDSINFDSPPSWWSTTIGLPMWLNSTANISTSLSEWQLMQLVWLIRDLELNTEDLFQVKPTARQVVAGKVTLIPGEIDPIVQDLFVTDEVKREARSVVVKNATHVDGLAALVSRFVVNMGGEVVAVEPADTSQTSSSITTEKESSLTKAINQFLGIPTTVKPQTGRERADIELIIGTDALARLGQ